MRLAGLVSALALSLPSPAPAQSAVIREAGVAAAGPILLFLAEQLPAPVLPACGPCDRSAVPFFDRWVIHGEIKPVQTAGHVVLGALLAYSWIDMARDGKAGFSHVRASFESGLVAAGVTGILKEVFHRKRPEWYTAGVIGQTNGEARDNLRSLPSRDTGIAFALATSYVLSGSARRRPYQTALAFAAAALIGTARIAGGKHYPSDVLAGAALGVGSAWLVHRIRF